MNIYPYIPSPDISAYCEKIGHEFNPLEMAIIVAMCAKSMKEKHSAFREIISGYPDMPIHKSLNFDAQESLHEYLRGLIAHEEKQIAEFYAPTDGAVFRFGLLWQNSNGWNDEESAFSSVDKTWSAAYLEEYGEFEKDIVKVKIEKAQLDSVDYAHKAYMSPNGELLDIDVYMNGESPDNLNMIFMHLPVPFERGDIVVTARDSEPRVLADLPHWWSGRVKYEDYTSGKIGDGSDMIPYFFLVNEDGFLIRDHGTSHDLWELRYYHGELNDQNHFLKYLSQYIKIGNNGDIDWLLNVFLKFRAETESERVNRLFGGWYLELHKDTWVSE